MQKVIRIYGYFWCHHTHAIARNLHKLGVRYYGIALDGSQDSLAELKKVCSGDIKTPVIIFPDHEIMIEPKPEEVVQKILQLRKINVVRFQI